MRLDPLRGRANIHTLPTHLFVRAVEPYCRIPRSLEQQGKGLAPNYPHTGMYHLLHKYWTVSFQDLQDIQIDREEVSV